MTLLLSFNFGMRRFFCLYHLGFNKLQVFAIRCYLLFLIRYLRLLVGELFQIIKINSSNVKRSNEMPIT